MDKDQVKGDAKKATGKVQEVAGRLTGDDDQVARGKARQTEGSINKAVGNAKDKVRDVADKIRGK